MRPRHLVGMLALALVCGSAAQARAEESATTDSTAAAEASGVPAGLSYTVEATASYHFVDRPYFGTADRQDDWGEGFTRARVNYGLPSGVWISAGGVGLGTAGTDYFGIHDVGDGRLDQLELGVSRIGATGLSLTVGRQDLVVGDGFVIGDGYRDLRAALWNIPLNFYDAVRADWTHGPWKALAFGARLSPSFGGDGAYPKGELMGGEAAWSPAETQALAVGYFHREDRGDTWLRPDAVSLRGNLTRGAVTVAGEAVAESGHDGDATLKAHGGHLCVGYAFPVRFKPTADLEYFLFSGDDPSTTTNEGYYAWQYRWNDWSHYYVGDLVASTVMTNTDARVWRLQCGVEPREGTGVRLFAHRMDLDTGASKFAEGLPAGVGRGFADEFDVVVDQSLGASWSAWVMGGYVTPREAGKAWLGSENSAQVFLSLSYKFHGPGGAIAE